jgi:hypothetical protein
MSVFDNFLTACVPTEAQSPSRRPSVHSISSTASKTRTLLTTIEETFDDFVHTVTEIPSAIEHTFDEFVTTVTEIPTVIEETFDEFVQSVNEYVMKDKVDSRKLFKSEDCQTPVEKLSRGDFPEIESLYAQRILVVKKELDFQQLMDGVSDDERRSSQESDIVSIGSSNYDTEREYSSSEMESPPLEEIREFDAQSYLMDLTSPGLLTPSPSLGTSASPRKSVLDVQFEESSNNATDTLVFAENVGSVVDDKLLPKYVDSLRDKPLPELPAGKEDVIPKYWRSELDKPLPILPYELVPGVVAV